MVQKNIRFMTTGQLMTFCNVCQKMNADITVKDVTGRFEIDAKSIVGLMTIRMGEKMHLLIEGEEEHLTVILKNLTVHRLRFRSVKGGTGYAGDIRNKEQEDGSYL